MTDGAKQKFTAILGFSTFICASLPVHMLTYSLLLKSDFDRFDIAMNLKNYSKTEPTQRQVNHTKDFQNNAFGLMAGLMSGLGAFATIAISKKISRYFDNAVSYLATTFGSPDSNSPEI